LHFSRFDVSTICALLSNVIAYLEEVKRTLNAYLPLNIHGANLYHIGMQAPLRVLLKEHLVPLLCRLFPRESFVHDLTASDDSRSQELEDVACYVVKYAVSESDFTGHPAHSDESYFTLNVCLGSEFRGTASW
jgi:hypothetical protein